MEPPIVDPPRKGHCMLDLQRKEVIMITTFITTQLTYKESSRAFQTHQHHMQLLLPLLHSTLWGDLSWKVSPQNHWQRPRSWIDHPLKPHMFHSQLCCSQGDRKPTPHSYLLRNEIPFNPGTDGICPLKPFDCRTQSWHCHWKKRGKRRSINEEL